MVKTKITDSVDMSFVSGKTKSEIILNFPNEPEIFIPTGTSILVDPEEGIGLVGKHHYFDIFPEEYEIFAA
jgi:hypothetical protein